MKACPFTGEFQIKKTLVKTYKNWNDYEMVCPYCENDDYSDAESVTCCLDYEEDAITCSSCGRVWYEKFWDDNITVYRED